MKAVILAACNLLWSAVFKPVIGSINGALIPGELQKAVAAATGAATVVAGLIAGLNAVIPDVPSLFSSPIAASLVTFILVNLVGQLGQLSQSKTGYHHESLVASADLAAVLSRDNSKCHCLKALVQKPAEYVAAGHPLIEALHKSLGLDWNETKKLTLTFAADDVAKVYVHRVMTNQEGNDLVEVIDTYPLSIDSGDPSDDRDPSES